MPDLYAILGVARTATPEDIKFAYHAKAKETHPDCGGSADLFTSVQTAYDVLSDPIRRAAYDRNGSIEDQRERVDDVQTRALGIIEQMLAQAITQLPSDGNVYNDVIAKMKDALRSSVRDLEGEIETNANSIAKLKRFAKRFSVKEGSKNYLAEMVVFKIAQHEQRSIQMKRALDWHARAKTILADFSFEWDAPQAAANPLLGMLNSGLASSAWTR